MYRFAGFFQKQGMRVPPISVDNQTASHLWRADLIW